VQCIKVSPRFRSGPIESVAAKAGGEGKNAIQKHHSLAAKATHVTLGTPVLPKYLIPNSGLTPVQLFYNILL